MAKDITSNLTAIPANIPEELIPVYEWWKERGPKTVICCGAVLAVCIGFVLWHLQGLKETDAAVTDIMQISVLNQGSSEAYEALVGSNSSKLAKLANLQLAKSYFDDGNFEEALNAYQRFLAEIDAPEFEAIATVGITQCQESLGQFDEAADGLNKFLGSIDRSHYLYGTAVIALARVTAQQGNKEKALEILKPLTTAEDGSNLAQYKMTAEQTEKLIKSYTPKSLFDKAAATIVPPAVAAPAATTVVTEEKSVEVVPEQK